MLQHLSKFYKETNPLLVAPQQQQSSGESKQAAEVAITPVSASPVPEVAAPISPQRPASASAAVRSSHSRSSPRLKSTSKSSAKLTFASNTATTVSDGNNNAASTTTSAAQQCILTPSQLKTLNESRARDSSEDRAREEQHVYNRAYEAFMERQERARVAQQAKQFGSSTAGHSEDVSPSELVDTLLAQTSPRSPRGKVCMLHPLFV